MLIARRYAAACQRMILPIPCRPPTGTGPRVLAPAVLDDLEADTAASLAGQFTHPLSAWAACMRRSFSLARLSICRTRSRVTPMRLPISCSVRGSSPSRP